MITGFESVEARINTQYSPVNTISDRQTRSTDPGAILIQRDGLIHDDLQGYMENTFSLPSAQPSRLPDVIINSTCDIPREAPTF